MAPNVIHSEPFFYFEINFLIGHTHSLTLLFIGRRFIFSEFFVPLKLSCPKPDFIFLNDIFILISRVYLHTLYKLHV